MKKEGLPVLLAVTGAFLALPFLPVSYMVDGRRELGGNRACSGRF